MTDMIEKMARAMIEREHAHASPQQVDRIFREYGDGYLANARAALSALQEPTDEMVEAGEELIPWSRGTESRMGMAAPEHFWRAMIKAAKGES